MSDFENRINELYGRSLNRGIFVFTDFLSPSKAEEVRRLVGSGATGRMTGGAAVGGAVAFFGGCDFAERVIARFGDAEELGYEEEFPIKLIKITLSSGKFSAPVTHRDVLGATLNLGIERDKLGDVFVKGNEAYVFASESVAGVIAAELKNVSRNPVEVGFADGLPDDFRPTTEEREISVPSNRADAIISRAYNLSRDESSSLFGKGLVAINGKIAEKGEKTLKPGDVVTARGFGKFAFVGEGGLSRKGKLYVKISVYI